MIKHAPSGGIFFVMYKYHQHLLLLYQNLETNTWYKTQKLRDCFENYDDYLDPKINYLEKKDFLKKTTYKIAEIQAKTRSDKMSNWWKFTEKGIAEICLVFGEDYIKKEDFQKLAKYFLMKE